MKVTFTLTTLFLIPVVISQETTSAVAGARQALIGERFPHIHNKSHAPKRNRRQYSSTPYEIRFVPFPRPTNPRLTRGSLGVEKSDRYVEALQEEYLGPQLTTSTKPPPTSTIPIATTFIAPGYRPPPSGTPRDTNTAENERALGNSHRYNYPPRQPLPLNSCFFNPTGYACCNAQLNDLMVETYTDLEAQPNFHTCNINAIATKLQAQAEKKFNVTFETLAGFDDFAQKIHFNGDLVCKIELGGKFMLAYGTAAGGTSGTSGATTGGGKESNGAANVNKYSGGPESRRHRRATAIYGPQEEVAPNHLSRSYSMWI